jgi:DNA-binding transcriptional MerR regulator
MTYLSVKALRHYHDVGLLEPARIDEASGYRLYAAEQVPVAQAIRRFRDLDMPIDEIRLVIAAPDDASRNAAILGHLERMQAQLEKTQATVASLQALLTSGPAGGAVELRSVAALQVLAIAAPVSPDDCAGWLDAAHAELHAVLARAAEAPAGPDGALYDEDFFREDLGVVTAFVPVGAADVSVEGTRGTVVELPAADCAVLPHHGSFDEIDRTYGELGTWVTAQGIGVSGPIRETYFADGHAEVAWPVASGDALAG